MTTITTTPASADELGTLLAQIASLTKQADAIKDAMKDVATRSDTKVFEGSLFKATFIEANRNVVDYSALIAELGCTDEQLARFTKTTAVFSIKTTAR
jgi:hypothetical protein